MALTEAMRRTWAMTWKDVRVELRARERMNAMLFFAALVLFVFNFALGPDREKLRDAAPGLLWLAFLFTGMLGLGRSFQAERENECFEELLLMPGDRESLYFGKLAGNILFMVMAEVLILPLFAILYNLDIWPWLPGLLLVALLGTVGFSTIGTLLAAMTAHLRAREVMLPLLLFPLTVPVILGAVHATDALLAGRGLSDAWHWIQLLAGFDVIFLVVCPLLFEFVLEE
ncbi:MAG: heme exporter protein CcmB [Zetaproteobacteria bacterium]|jgi:heme exporter protein B|nr:MAG: heme exporter protein CcmB [Zetaproteobacteria bacterium]